MAFGETNRTDMIDLHLDVAVIGSGFGGTLTALILNRLGLKTALIERGSHPRFALGESSTPLADLILQHLARQYDLPRVLPLGEYGTWQAAYPDLTCGLKRGFSYFKHQPDEQFTPRADHANELLVAASAGAADADTHWFRSEFDQFLVHESQAAGIPYLEQTELQEVAGGDPWVLRGVSAGKPLCVRAGFVVDASGEGQVLARHLKLSTEPASLHTNSRALYGHFTGVGRWSEFLDARGGRTNDHPFCCDDAALHHVLDGAWMWVLRFNNGVTSAGLMFDGARHPLDESLPPDQEWRSWMQRFPSVGAQFARAQLTAECGGLRRTRRLQRRAVKSAGPNWALLPLTAYALDALHSTGNAHTLCGVERLARILDGRSNPEQQTEQLAEYDRILQAEISLLDELVHGCYLGFSHFELMTAFAAWYIAGATCSEQARRQFGADPHAGFLLAHDRSFCESVRNSHRRLTELTRGGSASADAMRQFSQSVAESIGPYNIAGLCDPLKHNLYPYPATP